MKNLFFVFLLSFLNIVFGQEVKLGLPVGHTLPPEKVLFNSKSASILSFDGDDGKINLWDLTTGFKLKEFSRNSLKLGINSNERGKVLITNDERYITVSYIDSSYLFNYLDGELENTWRGTVISYTDFESKLNLIDSNKFQTIDLQTKAITFTYQAAEPFAIHQTQIINDSLILLQTSSTLYLIDVKNKNCVQQLNYDIEEIETKVYPDKSVLFIATESKSIFWDYSKNELINEFIGSYEDIEPDANLILMRFQAQLYLYNISSGQLLNTFDIALHSIENGHFDQGLNNTINFQTYDPLSSTKLWNSVTNKWTTFKGSDLLYLNDSTAVSDDDSLVYISNFNQTIKSFPLESPIDSKFYFSGDIVVAGFYFTTIIRNDSEYSVQRILGGSARLEGDSTLITENDSLIFIYDKLLNCKTIAKYYDSANDYYSYSAEKQMIATWNFRGTIKISSFDHSFEKEMHNSTQASFDLKFDPVRNQLLSSHFFSDEIIDCSNGEIFAVHNKPFIAKYLGFSLHLYLQLSTDGTKALSTPLVLFNTPSNLLWNRNDGSNINEMKGYNAIFCHNDNRVAVPHKNSISLYNSNSGALEKTLTTKKGEYKIIHYSSFLNSIIAINDEKDRIEVWDLKTNKISKKIKEHKHSLDYTTVNSDGSLLALVFTADTLINGEMLSFEILQIIDLQKYKVTFSFRNFSGTTMRDCHFSQSGNFLASSNFVLNLKSIKLFFTECTKINSENPACFNNDSLLLYSTEEGDAVILEIGTNRKSYYPKSTAFTFFGKNQIALANINGLIDVWDIKKNEKIITVGCFDSDPNKWVHIAPSGQFDASPEAMELMYWTKGLEVIDFAQLKDRYWVTGLWEKVMKGEALPDVRGMNELKLQPEISFGELIDGKIPVTLTQRDGGYGKVTVLINGKEISGDARGENFDKSKASQTIWLEVKDHPNLVDGENTIAVKAASEDGFVVSRPAQKTIQVKIPSNKPQFYAVVVGTGQYTNPNINLKFSEKDAQAMSTALKVGAEGLFGADKTHIYTLTTDQANIDDSTPFSGLRPTKTNIKATFDEISKQAKSNDVIVVYLSGHGISWGGDQSDFYYITTDATASDAQAYNDAAIRKNQTISSTEFADWLSNIPANKQVMIIDACSSGKAIDNLMAAREIDGSAIKAIDRMKDRTGMFVISGSTADAVSYEANRYGQGLLTYSILEAMKGAKLRENSFFDVDQLLNYAREKVPEYAQGVGGIQKPQMLIPKGGSFDIGFVTDETKKEIPLSSVKPVFVRSLFVDAKKFNDHLGLSKAIDEALNQLSSKGSEAPFVFFDASEFPDAYQLSGGYRLENGKYILTLTITKGTIESSQELSAKSKDELIEQILSISEQLQ